MILGIGVDIVENKRIQCAVERFGDRFLKRIFTDREIIYCMKRGKRAGAYNCLAARFAAKEAFIKASNKLNISHLRDIEVFNNEDGKPSLNIFGRAKEFMTEDNTYIHLSITHERQYSAAMVVIEKADSKEPADIIVRALP